VGVDYRPKRLVDPMAILMSAIGENATPEDRNSFPDRFQAMVQKVFEHSDELIDIVV
jgi:GTP cyclohydrolase I